MLKNEIFLMNRCSSTYLRIYFGYTFSHVRR